MVLPSSNRVSRAPPYSWTSKIASRTGLSPSMVKISILFWSQLKKPLAWSAFARHYLRSLVWCPFLRVLRYFSSPGLPLHPMYSGANTTYVVGFPIRISVGHSVSAANHSFSQSVTSFIASWNQGIHQMPFSFLSIPHELNSHGSVVQIEKSLFKMTHWNELFSGNPSNK